MSKILYFPSLNFSVLITGASGFLGKVLLEKLLFSQPGIHKIYLIIRPLKENEPKSRLKKLLEVQFFYVIIYLSLM